MYFMHEQQYFIDEQQYCIDEQQYFINEQQYCIRRFPFRCLRIALFKYFIMIVITIVPVSFVTSFVYRRLFLCQAILSPSVASKHACILCVKRVSLLYYHHCPCVLCDILSVPMSLLCQAHLSL